MSRGKEKTITGGNVPKCPSQAALSMVLLKMSSNLYRMKDKTELRVITNG